MAKPERSREPCPDRILDDVGGAFAMGAVGGTAFHYLKGLRDSPAGARLSGAAQAVRTNAPRVGGGFATWGGLFSVFDCALVYARQREDPWNSIAAGAATGGLLQVRQGLRAASRSAVVGGVLLALIEGAGIMVNKLGTVQQDMLPVAVEDEVPNKSAEATASWFGGWFGGRREEEAAAKGFKTEVLESFDSPVPPTFEFK